MKRTMKFVPTALIAGWLAIAVMPVLAQDIVIDSGSDETVISRIPSAEVEDFPVCFDSVTGQLGVCPLEPGLTLLGVYPVGADFTTTEPNSAESAEVECDAGDTAIAPGWATVAGDIRVTFVAAQSGANDNRLRAAYVTGSGSNFQFVLQGKCLDFPPAHQP